MSLPLSSNSMKHRVGKLHQCRQATPGQARVALHSPFHCALAKDGVPNNETYQLLRTIVDWPPTEMPRSHSVAVQHHSISDVSTCLRKGVMDLGYRHPPSVT